MSQHHPSSSRFSGILLHPTSLPGPHGIGDLGTAAFHFIDFLKAAGQTWWQILPINPPGYGESPYNTLSAVAGNPWLINLDKLREQGLLTQSDTQPLTGENATRISFGTMKTFKETRFKKAFGVFQAQKTSEHFETFCQINSDWLDDFALFQAIKENQNGRSWVDWPRDLRRRKHAAIEKVSAYLRSEISYQKFLQYQFSVQWTQLKKYAEKNNIRLMGDVPIFVAHDSADVWCHPTLFKLRQNGRLLVGAGVPPDYFSKTGQLWGNPVYRWSAHRKDHYRWWIKRLKSTLKLFDAIRLDHFIGFYRTWEVPADQDTAEHGKWVLGPRGPFFKHVLKELGPVKIVAEDLGNIIPPIQKLRKQFKFPGMFVLHFGFGGTLEAVQKRLHELDHRTVIYTGTHDNNTTLGWVKEMSPLDQDRQNALIYLKSDDSHLNWDMIQLALSSKADLAIVPLQDILGLGKEARMNQPGTSDNNWEWRFHEKDLTNLLAKRLFDMVKINNRIH